jgi:integrase
MAELTLSLADQLAKAKAEVARLEALANTSRPIRRRLRDRLSIRRIAALRDGFFADGGCLYLRVRDGRKSWIVRTRDRDYGLGGFPRTGLAEARDKRDALLKTIEEGRNPVAERRDRQQAGKAAHAKRMTFKQAAEAYVAAHEAEWKNGRHARQWLRSLETMCYPIFGNLDVALVDPDLVVRALAPEWQSKTKTARDVRGRIEKVLDFAATMGARSGPNAALWRGLLEHRLAKPTKIAKVKHMAAMPYRDVPGFWSKLVADNSLGSLALRLAILTGCRSSEVLEAPWSEFDRIKERVWTIPAARMKGGIVHRVPLGDAAIEEVLDALEKLPPSDWLFASQQQRKDRLNRPVSPMLMRRVLQRLGHDVSVHGFRSSFRDWAAEQATRFPREICELALAHRKHDQTEAAYWRSDMINQRRELMAQWAAFVTGGPADDKVVSFPARQSA